MLKFNCLLPRLPLRVQKIHFGKHLKLVGWPFIFRFPHAKITIGDNVKINSNFWSNLLGLYQRTIIVAKGNGEINIADNVGMSGCTIYAWNKIEIGEGAIIGANVKIMDNDFHPIDPVGRAENDLSKVVAKPVKIGKNVFIGCNSLILKGVTIGDNSVIGAGSVVAKDVPSNSVVAGNPAKVIKELKSEG